MSGGIRDGAAHKGRWALLNVNVMDGSHTAHNIQETLRDMLQHGGLAIERQDLVGTDHGGNLVAALQAVKMKRVWLLLILST